MVAQGGRLSLRGQVALSTRTDLRAEKDGLRHVEGQGIAFGGDLILSKKGRLPYCCR